MVIANAARKPTPPSAPYLSHPASPAAPGALSRIPHPVATPFVMPTPGIVTGPAQHWPAGLCLTPQGPFSPVEFTFTNTWQGYVGTTWVVAYAGETGEAGNPAHVPAVRLMSNQFDSHGVRNIQLIGDFPNAAMPGMPTLVAESSSVLTLRIASSQHFQLGAALLEGHHPDPGMSSFW